MKQHELIVHYHNFNVALFCMCMWICIPFNCLLDIKEQEILKMDALLFNLHTDDYLIRIDHSQMKMA